MQTVLESVIDKNNKSRSNYSNKNLPSNRNQKDTEDYTSDIVPLNERRGPFTMGLLWITMVTAFPCVLIGFQWYKDGITIFQVIACSIISCLILLTYQATAAYLGAKSGQTFGLLTRRVFGRWGSVFVSLNLLWIFAAWYSLFALMLADAFNGLFHWHIPTAAFAATLAIVMAFNNFFGFTGIANFARYFAAPLLICVIGYSFFKVLPTCPISTFAAAPHMSFITALAAVSSFIIGYGAWGNEPDYWRYGKPNKWLAITPITISLIIGLIIFPLTGWMIARMSGIVDMDAAANFINVYSFGGISAIAAIVLIACYFGPNDSGLYGMINTLENLKKLPHHPVCAAMAISCAVFAAWLSTAGVAKSLESMASLNCVLIPTVTVIMIAEFFIISRITGINTNFSKIPEMSSLPPIKWAAIISLLIGWTIGIGTAGVIPQLEIFHVGVSCLQGWVAAGIVYVPLRILECRSAASTRS